MRLASTLHTGLIYLRTFKQIGNFKLSVKSLFALAWPESEQSVQCEKFKYKNMKVTSLGQVSCLGQVF